MNENNINSNSSYKFLPRHILLQSLGLELILVLPLISFLIFLGTGYYEEPLKWGPLSKYSLNSRITILHLWFTLFFSSAFFGCMGSLVSYLSRGRKSMDEDFKNKSFVISIHVVGSIFGILMLLLFLGGFIKGNLFPYFDSSIGFLNIYRQFSGIENWAKLFVWAFIAGFSERLVPELLSNFTSKISKSSSDENGKT